MLPIIAPETLRGQTLFSGLTEPEKEVLLKGGRIRHLTRGEMLFAHGDPITHFYMIINGTIQLFRTSPDGHEKTVAIMKSSQTLCEDEIMDSCQGHRVNALAVEDTNSLNFLLYG